MTLRKELDGKVQDLFDHVNNLLDSDDALVVLFDGRRMVSYTHGFAASPSQLELLGVEIERSVRSAVGGQPINNADRRNREESNEISDRGDRASVYQHLRRADGGGHSRVADIGSHSLRSGDAADGHRRRAVGRVLWLAGETA
jgi:hypothetical protein